MKLLIDVEKRAAALIADNPFESAALDRILPFLQLAAIPAKKETRNGKAALILEEKK